MNRIVIEAQAQPRTISADDAIEAGLFDDLATVERDRQTFTDWAKTLDEDGLPALSRLMFGPPSVVSHNDDGTHTYTWEA